MTGRETTKTMYADLSLIVMCSKRGLNLGYEKTFTWKSTTGKASGGWWLGEQELFPQHKWEAC